MILVIDFFLSGLFIGLKILSFLIRIFVFKYCKKSLEKPSLTKQHYKFLIKTAEFYVKIRNKTFFSFKNTKKYFVDTPINNQILTKNTNHLKNHTLTNKIYHPKPINFPQKKHIFINFP